MTTANAVVVTHALAVVMETALVAVMAVMAVAMVQDVSTCNMPWAKDELSLL